MAKGADCKSAGLRLRRFESYLPHHRLPFVSIIYETGVRTRQGRASLSRTFGRNFNSEVASQPDNVGWMIGVSCVVTGLRCQKALRFISFTAIKQDDGANNSWYHHEVGVVGCGSKFIDDLISAFEALEKRKRFTLKSVKNFSNQRLAGRNFPPNFLVGCASQSGPNTTFVVAYDGFGLTAAVMASHFRDIDAQIHGKAAV